MIIQMKGQSVGNLYWARNAVVGQRRLPFVGGGSWPTASSTSTYRVLYDGNNYDGGSVPEDTNEYEEGATATVLGPGTMARSGWIFTGWTDGGIQYTEDDPITIGTSDITLTATWSPDLPPP